MNHRHNFSNQTKKNLASAANFRCVRPGCCQVTHFFDNSSNKHVHVGNAAHDIPANKGGPRGEIYDDVEIDPNQVKAYNNGAWLCCTCARLVDIVPHLFPVGDLQRWQTEANQRIKSSVMHYPSNSISIRDACKAAKLFCSYLRDMRFESYIPHDTFCKIGHLLQVSGILDPVNELCTLYPHTLNLQKQTLKILWTIKLDVNAINSPWHFDDSYRGYILSQPFSFDPRDVQEKYRVASDRYKNLTAEFFRLKGALERFSIGQGDNSANELW